MRTNGDHMAQADAQKVLRLPEVRDRTGLSKSEIYRRVAQKRFPAGRRISHRVTVWIESEVVAWQAVALLGDVAPECLDLL